MKLGGTAIAMPTLAVDPSGDGGAPVWHPLIAARVTSPTIPLHEITLHAFMVVSFVRERWSEPYLAPARALPEISVANRYPG
jgi:hypothetical protein